MDNLIKEIINKINVGKAVLFVGAGFSKNCINIDNNNLPLGKDLAHKICELGKFDISDDLTYASERYIDEGNSLEKLVELLKNELTIKEVSKDVKKICTLIPWHKIYTTNYDNAIETCLSDLIPLDLTNNVNDYYIQDKRCLHINGYIKNLNTKNINKGFYLSDETSLADIFNNSAWSNVFTNDIDTCSCAIFIGYSLFDYDIRKVIHNQAQKENIYFIVSKDSPEDRLYQYKKFGKPIPIGVEGFSQQILEHKDLINFYELNNPQVLTPYELLPEQNITISDKNLIDMFVYGKINIGLLEKSVLRDNNYVIFRKKIEYISNELLTDSVLITSELGNGKTIFLKESLPILRKKYKHIYVIEEYTSDILKKIEETCNQFKNELIIFVIDDYNYFIPLLTYIMNFNLSNIRFLLSSRTSKHYKHKQLFLDKKIRLLSYSLDRLNDNEIKSFIERLDTIGFWKKEYFSLYKKEELLKEYCNKQISSILLEIFNSEEIKRKIEELKLELFKNEAIKEVTFVSLFIGTIFSKIYRSTLYRIVGNNAYSEEITSNENFTSIFHVTSSEIESFSKVFNQNFLQEFYDPDYSISKLFNIATKASKYSKQDINYREILKHCLKFSVIESILPDEQKRKKIIYYYDQIKRKVKWLENDPHYWLQYGMGYLSFKEYETAEKYFNYAYNCAKNKSYAYDVENIDTQYARLYFMKAIDEDNITLSFSLFKKGHLLICEVSNSKYKYRQLAFYQEYYRAKHLILENNKNKFFEMCKKVKISLDKESIVDSSEESLMFLRIEELENIIKHIKEGVVIFTPLK